VRRELSLLGAEDVAIYDGSMEEWAADSSLPIDCGRYNAKVAGTGL
jgi:3-mercaptopyruvate sulfurtransferase SseA